MQERFPEKWNASTNPIVAGYNIYFWIAGGVSTNKGSVGKATSVTISSLIAGATYYFAATAYDASGFPMKSLTLSP